LHASIACAVVATCEDCYYVWVSLGSAMKTKQSQKTSAFTASHGFVDIGSLPVSVLPPPYSCFRSLLVRLSSLRKLLVWTMTIRHWYV
jgi:hypothetical protein